MDNSLASEIAICIIAAWALAVLAQLGRQPLIIAYLAVLVPSLAVAVRRLHDTGKSGWFVLIGLVPLVGGIVMLVFTVMDSTPGDNQYGPNPKGIGSGLPPMGYGMPPA